MKKPKMEPEAKAEPNLPAADDQNPPAPETTTPEAQIPRNGAADEPGKKQLGTAKGVETMFRNAVRTELEIIALAATKANIMISLNGLIISALMISGAFIFASTAAFLLPAGVFLTTAAASIIFALLAASPEKADCMVAFREWLRDVVQRKYVTHTDGPNNEAPNNHAPRKVGLRDLPVYLRRAEQVDPDSLNLLIYSDRVRLSRDDYWQRMQDLLRDRDGIYQKMSDQIYWLGLMADRKFKLLNISYTIFRWGLLASVLTFVGVKSVLGVFPGLNSDSVPRLRNLGIAEFQDIYEPSGVQQLPDGRILVVEDESSRAFSMMTLQPDGTLLEDASTDTRITRGFGRKLSDLEGLSVDDAGQIYAITSHSQNGKGERKPDREQLLRFEIQGNVVGNIRSNTNLRDAIANDAQLIRAAQDLTGTAVDFDRLNIEGLAYWRETQHLLLGLREPMASEKSLILTIKNPAQVFDNGAVPEFGPPIALDLKGGGIRALSYDPVLGAFLIVNEIEGYDDNRYSQLWSWSGDPSQDAEPIALPDIINLNNVESIDSITIDGEPRLLLMSDEGNKKKNRPARYMILEYGQLVK